LEKRLGFVLALVIMTSPVSAAFKYLPVGAADGSCGSAALNDVNAEGPLAEVGRTENKVKIFVRKEYLDDDTLNEYIGLAHGGYDIASEAAFRYLDYEVTINIVFDIPFEDEEARESAIEELRWKREKAAVWADEVLANAPDERDAYIILILKAEMQHEKEMEAAVEEFERFSAAAASAYEYGGPIPEKPLIKCDVSRATLKTLTSNCRDSKLLAYAWYFLGFIAQEESKLEQAEACYLKAYELAKDRYYFSDICFRLGEMAACEGDYRKAVSFYEKVPSDSDNYGPALYGICYAKYALAGLESNLGYDEEAVEVYVKLDEERRHTAINEHCSRISAASLLEIAAVEGRTSVNAHEALAVFDERLSGRLSDRGAATFLRALAQNFDKRRNDYDEAIVVYVALLDRYPEYEENAGVIEEISRVFRAEPDRETWYRRLFLARYGRDTAFYDDANDGIRMAIDRFVGE
jgi:tetratricopeptide (TPR) repeat protein